jgi:hypothetical protein
MLRLHRDGLEFLRVIGLMALALGFFALRLSSWPAQLLARITERVFQDFPPPSPDHETTPDPRVLRKQNRQLREQTRRTFRETNRRIRLRETRKRMFAFDWFAGALAAYLILDWFLIPEPYRLSDERRWPIAISVFLSGTLIVFMGLQVWDGRVGWKKWTFWLSLTGTSVVALCLAKVCQPLRPSGVLLVMLTGGIFFVWFFGKLRHIDQNEPEVHPAGEVTTQRREN